MAHILSSSLDISGSITATRFVGDASGLTGNAPTASYALTASYTAGGGWNGFFTGNANIQGQLGIMSPGPGTGSGINIQGNFEHQDDYYDQPARFNNGIQVVSGSGDVGVELRSIYQQGLTGSLNQLFEIESYRGLEFTYRIGDGSSTEMIGTLVSANPTGYGTPTTYHVYSASLGVSPIKYNFNVISSGSKNFLGMQINTAGYYRVHGLKKLF